MSAYSPKAYQSAVLASVEAYFRACHRCGNADTAFYEVTRELWDRGIPYRGMVAFDHAMPYFRLRVPTGGGKTWLAAKSVTSVNTDLLRCEHSVILWLVPSNAIREQTLKALNNRHHPYHAALRDAGSVTVLDLDEAKTVTPATLDTSTTVIVCTRQAFQVDNTDTRKVYESSGALMAHFQNLTAEQMIKLPIVLRTEQEWEKYLHYALDQREQLQAAADAENRAGCDYLRPIVLIQAEQRSSTRETLDVDRVRSALITHFHVPEDEIVVATGAERGLEKIEAEYENGVADHRCPVKFVITQQALAEGWDCPSAYVLVSMAELQSATAVEQLLGRVLRQPQALHRDSDVLNQSYAFVVSRHFGETARALRDRLVRAPVSKDARRLITCRRPIPRSNHWIWTGWASASHFRSSR